MLLITTAITIAAAIASVFLPHPLDKDDWGLRIRHPALPNPLLVGESLESAVFEITLLNFSKESREHSSFADAKRFGDMKITITQPDGKWLKSMAGPFDGMRSKATQKSKLQASQHITHEFRFSAFGYSQLDQSGRYRVDASFMIDGKKILAPSVDLVVVEVQQGAISANLRVPLEGREVSQPEAEQGRPFVQQVNVGVHTFLIYRRYHGLKWGDKPAITTRIAELPAKVEDLKVEGAFGDGNPLTITYRETTYTKWTTTHVINSIDGRPWTAEEEKLRQEKLKRDAKPPADKK